MPTGAPKTGYMIETMVTALVENIAAELAGGIALIVGFQTRLVALALSVILLGSIYTPHFSTGFLFSNPNGGWEFPAFWALTLWALALLGEEAFDACFLDLKLGADDGLAVLEKLLRVQPALAVVMFTDIVGFTPQAEDLQEQETADMLNHHFALLGACIEETQGVIDKYIGDCVMAVWGGLSKMEDHADQAIHAALEMARVIREDNRQRAAEGKTPVRLRIGLHSGPVVVGNIGALMLWAALIVLIVGLGFATLFVGLVIAVPLIGHATWHAYQALVGEH